MRPVTLLYQTRACHLVDDAAHMNMRHEFFEKDGLNRVRLGKWSEYRGQCARHRCLNTRDNVPVTGV